MPPSFSAGYREPARADAYSPPPPRTPRPVGYGEGGGASRPFLYCLLILACVGLGALLNWAVREHRARTNLAQANVDISKSYTFVLAKRNDLAGFLTDERTRLYRLPGHGEVAGRTVTVAWQEATRTGILIGDRMPVVPEGQVFAIWHLDSTGRATACGTFVSAATGTFFDFRALGAAADAVAAGFLVTREAESAERDLKQPGGPVVYGSR
jgi:hypothetical protein